jgi:hypothetical protein
MDTNGYIPGIYNYCDRWCERCAFTSRCKSFAMELRVTETSTDKSEGASEPDLSSKAFWDELNETMRSTLEYLRALNPAEEEDRRIVNDQQWEERKKKDEELEAEAGQTPLSIAAWAYSEAVETWMEEHKELLDTKFAELETRIRLDAAAKRAATETDLIRDAIEIIRWYEAQIWVKLMRAITGKISESEAEKVSGLQSDSAGSAKVALIGMDSSLSAWEQLHFIFPEHTDEFINILLQLDRLRKQAELEFPSARAFVRAGFDDTDLPQT